MQAIGRNMPWKVIEIGSAPPKSGIYRFSSLSNARGNRGQYMVRYVGQAKKTRRYNGLKSRLTTAHPKYRTGDKVEIFVISDPDTKYRRVEPEDRRTSMTKLQFKERMELHSQMTRNSNACGRNSDLKRWRREWISAGAIPIKKW